MFQNALHSKSKLFVNKKQCAKLSVYLIRRKLFQKIINTRACRIATVTAIYNHGIISWYNKPFSGFCFSENCLWSPSFSEKLIRSADSSVSIHYLITSSMRVLHPFFRVHVIMVNRGVSSSVTPLQVLVLWNWDSSCKSENFHLNSQASNQPRESPMVIKSVQCA